MSDQQTNKAELIERILDDARGEGREIRDEARRSVDERRKTLERRLAQIAKEADERVASERERLESQADSAIALAEGRARLETEDRVYRAAYAAARERLRAMRTDTHYDAVVRAWIVEAAAGLGADRATVAAPAADRDVVERVLEAAEALVRERTGREISLELDPQTDPGGQGVVLRDAAGRRAFSNLVDDRLRRLRGEAQRIVYEEAVRTLESTAGTAGGDAAEGGAPSAGKTDGRGDARGGDDG